MIEDNGGQAFPAIEIDAEFSPSTGAHLRSIPVTRPGMTLRDYFAAKAMQGLLAQSMGTALGGDPLLAAGYAYGMADAMLKARQA